MMWVRILFPIVLPVAVRWARGMEARILREGFALHTAQYERLGGFRAFLKTYLTECIELGYPNSPLEQEAIDKAHRLYL